MGKDQELLEAARCGNYAVVERILNQRARKTGPLASLRRGPGPNVQDNNGYTPLHHACLNGHKDVVELLLSHEASANIVDHKGCTPLHLASWSGNAEIVELLLTQGPSFPSVNHMNFDHESALHSAAQYGHTDIIKLLLENKCYPSVRNVRNESPLDLASQYGRLETVECLLNAHPGLLSDIVRCHSPLHLAAKNGHKHVVKLLLDSGFDINYMTDIGTALHEAAMYGKLEVVRLLLDYGIDPILENSRKRTVFDILGDLNTSIAKQIEKVIRDHVTLIKLDMGSNDLLPILPPQGFVMGSNLDSLFPERCSLSGITPPRQFCSPTFDDSLYDVPPPHKMVDCNSPRANNSLNSLTNSYSQDSCLDQTSCSSCSPSKCDPAETIYENNIYQNIDTDNLLYEIPPPPSLFSNKRYSDPSQQCSIYQNVILPETNEGKVSSWPLQQNSYISMLPSNPCIGRPQPPAKPPRKSVSPHSSEAKSLSSQRNSYEFLCLATTGLPESSSKFLDRNKNSHKEDYASAYQKSEYVDMANKPIATYENHDIICSNVAERKSSEGFRPSSDNSNFSEILPFHLFGEDGFRKGSSFTNLMPSKSTPALHASRHTLDQVVPTISKEFPLPISLNVKKRASVHFPSSPTNYAQPPTPDNPPPSPGTAEIGIHEKIHPVGQNIKKQTASRDIETLTDEQLVATVGPHGEVELTLATDNKCVSTESFRNNPFAGLHHGSVSASLGRENPAVFLNQFRKASSKSRNIYENVQVAMEEENSKVILSVSDCGMQNNCGLSVMSPFDEKAEWAEIAGIMASFGGSITRESLFAQDVESQFAQAFKADSKNTLKPVGFSSLEQWLTQLGLPQYENLLVISGFDDIKFLGGNIVEEVDLQEIGIHNDGDRQKLCTAAQNLPAIQPITAFKGTEKFPQSVDDWLKSINLQEYSENFSNNNITDMNRALKLWEVELNTVLKIPKLGHRKRILASLGDKNYANFVDSKDIDLSTLTLDLSELEVIDNANKGSSSKENSSKRSYDNQNSNAKPYFRIRSPTQLMSDSRNPDQNAQHCTIDAQWRHHPDELVINSCNYIAKYLGSTLVKELHGLESTKMSIQKLKTSTKDIGKIPSIILSISYSGVKFINAENQQLVCEHEIRNIHCACQDAEDLRFFAYITKEHQTHNHYCHVFSSHTVELASEIILTLGQAFEVAYQMAMKEKAERACNTGQKTYISPNLS
ncbi:hypothetical protein JTE90_016838 [Oedothorax gibbosus]|uniref:Ankyrin repeat and sterile alpha motif domain-containing protein 1B n=1 Tax=Oedothorax gibbosus TaxID=931172 RepID=A0AAV6VZS2_9ARAC|nr:hypothetical protein JTE90_016838 [Oedothorax gibbosus]